MLSLGIIASSFQVSGALDTFSTGVNIAGASINSLAFVNGTAVFSSGGTGSRYATAPAVSTTLGGATIDSPNGSWGANGVVLKTGRRLDGTATIARTTDGGQTWGTALNVTRTGDRIQTVAYGNVGGTARWIAPVHGDNDVYLSTNNGSSFTEQAGVLAAEDWVASTRMGSAFGVFAAGTTVYYTSEIGTTWTLRTLPSALFSNDTLDRSGKLVASSDDTTMALAGSVVLTSSDLVSWSTAGTVPVKAGETWQSYHVAYGSANWVVIAEADSDLVEAFVSTNNGTSWTAMTVQGSASAAGSAADIAFNDTENAFYFISASGTANRIWRAGA